MNDKKYKQYDEVLAQGLHYLNQFYSSNQKIRIPELNSTKYKYLIRLLEMHQTLFHSTPIINCNLLTFLKIKLKFKPLRFKWYWRNCIDYMPADYILYKNIESFSELDNTIFERIYNEYYN